MSSLKFILRLGKKTPTRETPIYLQYIHAGEKCLIATGKKCEPRHWNTSQGKPKADTKLEASLDTFKKRFRDNAVFTVIGEPIAYKVRDGWDQFLIDEKHRLPEAFLKGSLLARWTEYIAFIGETLHKGKTRTADTIRNNTNSRTHLSDFLKEKGKTEIRPEKFSIHDFQAFEAYLVKALSPNTVSKVKKHFKSFLKWHQLGGGSFGFNVSLIEYSETPGIKITLSEKELAAIASGEFGVISLARDLMVLQASTGVRISDLQRLCDHLNEDKTAFKLKTKKTGGIVLVPVLPLAKEVLERRSYQIPYMPEQTYREGIKAIYKKLWPSKTMEVGDGDKLDRVLICKEISSHDMVRTFINIAWKKGISVPTIATITGKSIQVLLRNYLSEDKEHAAQELLEKFDVSPLRIAK